MQRWDLGVTSSTSHEQIYAHPAHICHLGSGCAFMSLIFVEGYFAPLQTVLGPNHWCVYGKFELCFLQGDYRLLATTLGYCSIALVSAGYCWLQWRLIWKR